MTSRRAAPPNVLVVLVDDLGFSDLGCYGSEIATPNLDRLAANGLRFTEFSNTAKCHSSRVSLLSGLYCRQAGDIDLTRAVPEAGFYTTVANVDYAIDFLAEARAVRKPWFPYVAFNAPHGPLQPLDGMKATRGGLVHAPAHLVDVPPMLAEFTGIRRPDNWPWRDPEPLAGVSLAPTPD